MKLLATFMKLLAFIIALIVTLGIVGFGILYYIVGVGFGILNITDLIVLLAIVLTFVIVLNLRNRVQKLEQTIKNVTAQIISEPSTGNIPPQPPKQQPRASGESLDYAQQQLGQGIGEEKIKSTPIASGWTVRFFAWLKEDWLLKLGAMLLLFGFGWFTTYAFLNNWIGERGRIALGIVAGALFILLGWLRIGKYVHQGGVFLVLGSTTILLTIFAARELYDFFTPFSALFVMFLSTVFVALASVRYNSRALALASLILASIAPLLTNAPTPPNYVGLFWYLLMVTLGTIWIVVLTGRRELTTAALIMITLYSLPHFSASTVADIGILLLFAYAFAALFFLTNTAGILKLKGKEIIPDLVTAAGNGLFLLSWIMVAAPDEWKSLIISAWMVVFVVGAFLIFRITQRQEPFYVYAGIGIAMLAAATSAELKGATLTIAYTIESGIIALIAYTVLRDIKIAERISLLLIGPVLLSFNSIASRAWATSVIHTDFFVLLVLGVTLLGLGTYFLRRVKEVDDKEPQQLNAMLLIAGSVYAYVLLWLSLHAALLNDNIAVMISLVIYTIIGLTAYFYGLANEKKGIRLYGGALVGFVVGRLLFVDVREMELASRIVTFFLIGALLVSTAFLGKKAQHKKMLNTN